MLLLLRRCRGHPVEPDPAQRVRPRPAHRPRALVAGPGGGPLAAEGVVRVEPPQTAVVAHPGRVVADRLQPPGQFVSGPDRAAVTARVVDERDRERPPARLRGPGQQPPAGVLEPVDHPAQRRELDGDDVVARQEGTRVRPGPGIDHRMVALAAQLGIVPAAAQIGAGEIVRRRPDPGRRQVAVVVGHQVDRDRLPVGLVVVDPVERRAPVVERVEVPVLQHRVAAGAQHPAVGGADGAGPVGLLAGLRERRRGEPVRRRDEAAGNAPADEQREPDERVDQPRQHADGGEPRLAPQARPVLPAPRRDLGPGELLLDEPEIERPVPVPDAGRREPARREFPGRDQLLDAPPAPAAAVVRPEAALREVRLDRRRQEQLACRVAQHRLVGAQQRKIGIDVDELLLGDDVVGQGRHPASLSARSPTGVSPRVGTV